MNLCTLALAGLLLAGSALGFARPDYQSPEVTPFPQPAMFTNGTTKLAVDVGALAATCNGGACPAATAAAFGLLKTNLQQGHLPVGPAHTSQTKPTATLSSVQIAIADPAAKLDSHTNESYTLTIPADGGAVHITAATAYGAVLAIVSFSQMMELQGSAVVLRGAPWHIVDSPRYAHRAMLLDTSRHFLPLQTIREMIDAMAFVKLNVLHWHLVDDVSFPFISKQTNLGRMSAWNPAATYTDDDLAGIVAYAEQRAVRVMVEIDTPGHTGSWRFDEPAIVTACPNTLAKLGPSFLALDPSNNATFDVLRRLLSEIDAIFPDNYFHVGGDEVRYECWQENENITAFMQAHNFGSDYSKLQNYYEARLLAITAEVMADKTIVIYQDTLDNGVDLPKNLVIDAWKSTNGAQGSAVQELHSIVQRGYYGILANGPLGEWYLNDGYGNGADGGRQRALWSDVYVLDPLANSTLTKEEEARILGGEASLWGEEINAYNILSKAWPRGAAFAERMWSPQDVNSVELAAPRLARLVCRMNALGIPASPISPGNCVPRFP